MNNSVKSEGKGSGNNDAVARIQTGDGGGQDQDMVCEVGKMDRFLLYFEVQS